MRGWFALTSLTGLALLSACSPQPARESRQENLEAFDADDRAAASEAPGISPTAAPGVAFNYRYAFRMPNTKISAVQEQHAAACEKLGIAKCRITGMRYKLVDGDTVEAMLAFKLDPVLARQFGKDGIAAVTAAEGMLVDSEISGVDEGANIKASDARSQQLRAELADLDRRIADKSVSESEKSELRRRADGIRAELRDEVEVRDTSAEAIANTPMVFHYGSGSAIPGWDGESPLKAAWKTAIGSFMTMLSFIIIALGVLLPWLVLGLIAIKIAQSLGMARFRQWLFRNRGKGEADAEPKKTG